MVERLTGILSSSEQQTILNGLAEVGEMTDYEAALLPRVGTLLSHENEAVQYAAADTIYALARLDGCFVEDNHADCEVMSQVYDELPVATKTVNPDYPAAAREGLLNADVRLKILVDSRGRVAKADVLERAPFFEANAIKAVKKWRFEPASGTVLRFRLWAS
jgi:TonB family protein